MILQAIFPAVVDQMSDFNFFLDPAIETRFFGGDPFRKWLNSYNAFFYVVMSLLTPFARWFSVLLWTLISLLTYIYSLTIVRSFLPKIQNAPRLEFFIVPLLLLVLIFDNIQLEQIYMLILCASLLYYHYHNNLHGASSSMLLNQT